MRRVTEFALIDQYEYEQWDRISDEQKQNATRVILYSEYEKLQKQCKALAECLGDVIWGEPKEASTKYPYAENLIEDYNQFLKEQKGAEAPK